MNAKEIKHALLCGKMIEYEVPAGSGTLKLVGEQVVDTIDYSDGDLGNWSGEDLNFVCEAAVKWAPRVVDSLVSGEEALKALLEGKTIKCPTGHEWRMHEGKVVRKCHGFESAGNPSVNELLQTTFKVLQKEWNTLGNTPLENLPYPVEITWPEGKYPANPVRTASNETEIQGYMLADMMWKETK